MKRPGSHSVEMARALKLWRVGMTASDMNAIAARCKVSPSGLFRAIKRAEKAAQEAALTAGSPPASA